MASLFGVLDIASRGLFAAERGIQTAGHNIANAGTPGYSVQRQALAATHPLPHPSGHLGTGVEQITIERVHDVFIQEQLLRQGGSFGAIDTQANSLSLIEEVLNEQDSEGITAALSHLYEGFSDLAAASTPGAPVERAEVRSAAQSLTDTMHALDRQLRDLQRSADTAISALLPEVNEFAARIQELNEEIVRTETIAPANDLRDQRDLLVRQLSNLVDVKTYEEDSGAVVVALSNGLPLVEGGFARTLEAQADLTNPFDPTFLQVRYRDGSNDIDVTAEIGAGQVGGLLRARDTLYPSAIRSLDTLAYNLAVSVNGVHNLGVGLDGTVGDFFAAPAAVENAARDLALDANILSRSDAIAAGLTTAPSDNQNALALAALRDAAAPIFLPGDPPGPASGPTRTVLEHVSSIVADIGQQARTMSLARDQQARVLETLENRRDQVSGVSIDEEVTQLIRLQAAFQANSRVISVVNGLLQDIIDIL
jgi:flagellar hook-associated protein 1 FlgK